MAIQNLGSGLTSSAVTGASPVDAVLQILTGERELSRVRYTFKLAKNAGASWEVQRLHFGERLSSHYSVQLDLISPEGHDDPDQLLGESCTVMIERQEASRKLHGIISMVRRGQRSAEANVVSITVVPAIAALAHRTDSRIFGGSTGAAITIPEVLQKVLEAELKPYERTVNFSLTRKNYPKREYITQHRETDLAFVQRLMAEEGIWYYFDHESDDEKEVLVVVDANEGAVTPTLGERGNELPLYVDGTPGFWQCITQLERTDSIGATSVSVRELNWTNPPLDRMPKKAMPKDSESAEDLGPRALYQPHDVALWDYDAGSKVFRKFDTDDQARLRWEYEQCRVVEAHGVGNLVALAPGQKVTLRGHPAGLDGDWLIISVHGEGSVSTAMGDHNADHAQEFRNSFTCLPFDVAFRPERLAKPRVDGIQTAVVVGPDGKPETKGDDIHTDEHGRIQVKFPWDRTKPGAQDATNTCFLRVAQVWGGSGWGFVFIPRIGMEVIVNFVDGDPDQPMVTGCVYNGMNQAFQKLPDEKTKSYIRTSSSPGGKGFNELRFEDKHGKEEIYLHAQKDHTEQVLHNHAKTIGADRSVSVGGNENYSVKHDQTIHVTKNRSVTVDKNETYTVTGTEDLTVTGQTTEVYHGGRKRTVEKKDETITSKADKLTTVDGKYQIKVNDFYSLQHGDDNKLYLKDELTGSVKNKVEFVVGANSISIEKSGKITLSAEKELTLVCGAASISMKQDGTIEVSGAKKIALGSGPSAISAEPAGVNVSGPKINSSAIGIHEIGGALIKVG